MGRGGGHRGQCATRHRRRPAARPRLPRSPIRWRLGQDGVIVSPFACPRLELHPSVTLLMTVGLVFLLRAASKDRTTVVDVALT